MWKRGNRSSFFKAMRLYMSAQRLNCKPFSCHLMTSLLNLNLSAGVASIDGCTAELLFTSSLKKTPLLVDYIHQKVTLMLSEYMMILNKSPSTSLCFTIMAFVLHRLLDSLLCPDPSAFTYHAKIYQLDLHKQMRNGIFQR